MYKLPSEAKESAQNAVEQLQKQGSLSIYEPCNCGSHIRHNNGGNYHTIISLAKDVGKFYVKYESTSELIPPAEWEEIKEQEAIDIVIGYADWL